MERWCVYRSEDRGFHEGSRLSTTSVIFELFPIGHLPSSIGISPFSPNKFCLGYSTHAHPLDPPHRLSSPPFFAIATCTPRHPFDLLLPLLPRLPWKKWVKTNVPVRIFKDLLKSRMTHGRMPLKWLKCKLSLRLKRTSYTYILISAGFCVGCASNRLQQAWSVYLVLNGIFDFIVTYSDPFLILIQPFILLIPKIPINPIPNPLDTLLSNSKAKDPHPQFQLSLP